MTDKWRTATFELPPIAPRTGPFPTRAYLETWWDRRGEGDLILTETDKSLAVLVKVDDSVTFAGEADLTDYHSPLGSIGVESLTDAIQSLPERTRLSLDSLPSEASEAVAGALRDSNLTPTVEQHTVSAVLELPDSFDDYLMMIGKKERHELRRKRRRFDNEVGPARLERREGPEAVKLFAHLHRLSAGDKGEFMTPEMEDFFLALHLNVGGCIDVLLDGNDRPASAIFSFEDDEGFYLYNSAFEPELRTLSPGNVMLSHLIEQAIESGKRVFDFLKGDETYKFRLGAEPRPLYAVTATVGESA